MIKEIIDTAPFIHFGFNRQEIDVYLNENIVIWQDKLLLKDTYLNAFITATDSEIVEVSNNKITLFFKSLGSRNVSLFYEVDGIKKEDSNIIRANVIERTLGATDLFFGNETITFND